MTLFLSCSDNPRLDFPSEDDLRQKAPSSSDSSSSVVSSSSGGSSSVGESSSSYYADSSSSSSETAVSSSSEMSSSGVGQSSSSVGESSSSYYADSSSSSSETAVSSSSEMSSSSVWQSSSSVGESSSSCYAESSSSSLETAVSSSSEMLVCGETDYDPAEESCCNNSKVYTPTKQFCDSRDGKVYAYVTMGTQTWMAENLNYAESGSVYNNETCGRLYNFAMAEKACPQGWHLSTHEEWESLLSSIGNYAINLKVMGQWNGNDYYGFSAQPCGRGSSEGKISGVGDNSWWWTTKVNGYFCYRRIETNQSSVTGGCYPGYDLFSYVRCVQD